ncbi:UBA domain-containing protein 7 [Cladorrhinum sp. PSN332]|nr:UBA domain-containing protein 7 [Cladorrhinum sp. PSN332]
MDDLSGLNWSAPNPAKKPTQSIPTIAATTAYPSLRPNPSPLNSGRNTPLSIQGSGSAAFKAPAPASKPAGDSFSNLLNFGTGKSNANLTLRERQEQIEAEKRKKEEERRKQAQAQFGDGRFLESLGQSSSGSLRTPSPSIAPPPIGFGTTSGFGSSSGLQNGRTVAESDDDLFAAFKAETKVDNSSHFPPPASSPAPPTALAGGLDLSNPNTWGQSRSVSNTGGFGDDDDDPFGLNQLSQPKARAPPPPPLADDEDDLLGDLGKPVDQVRKKTAPTFSREPEPGKAIEDDSSSDSEPEQPTATAASDDPFDRAVAQLVDYGFSVEDARRGLTESGAGLDVQATVNWLLDDAHRRAKEQAKEKRRGGAGAQPNDSGERASSQPRSGAPSWIGPLPGDGSRGRNNHSPASADGDFAKTAAAVGTTLFKTANNLWKTGQKKVQKAVAELQQDGGDPNQPKWMRSAQQERAGGGARREVPDVTDEAMMLEGGGGARQGIRAPSNAPSRERSPALPVRPAQGSQPKWQQQSQPALDPRARLSKQAAEEESFQAYVSPSRRKKATPQPQSAAAPAEFEPDLLFGGSSASLPSRSTPTPLVRSAQPSPAPRPAARQTPIPRPAPARPARQIPHISSIALQSSNKHRLEGTAHFKRGDYAAAHASYASSLSAIPQDHPLAVLLLCNRALTALKTGEPRQAVLDADAAIKLIGEGKGEGEQVDVQGENGNTEKREMRDLYGKALTRKAEALEQMEKWADALTVWQLCVQSNLGGATAAAGRQRCQKALAPKPAPRPAAARPAAVSRPKPTPSPSGGQKSAEAVQRLRAANQAAAREGDEKIALTDKVDARIAAWRDGKRDNLRALLSSLDNVLWEGSGWKKVGLHELVVANKVKIVYMKAIAKTHPDKIAQDATTEVRMIAGTVFSTLNEAWDKFKAQNNL